MRTVDKPVFEWQCSLPEVILAEDVLVPDNELESAEFVCGGEVERKIKDGVFVGGIEGFTSDGGVMAGVEDGEDDKAARRV